MLEMEHVIVKTKCFAAAFVLLVTSGAQAGIIDLGTADTFAVLAGSTVTNTGPTTVHGDLGVWPGTAITGFGPGIVTGGTMPRGRCGGDDGARRPDDRL